MLSTSANGGHSSRTASRRSSSRPRGLDGSACRANLSFTTDRQSTRTTLFSASPSRLTARTSATVSHSPSPTLYLATTSTWMPSLRKNTSTCIARHSETRFRWVKTWPLFLEICRVEKVASHIVEVQWSDYLPPFPEELIQRKAAVF